METSRPTLLMLKDGISLSHIVNIETSRPTLLMLKGGISISHIVNMETSRPTLLMLKGGISLSHIVNMETSRPKLLMLKGGISISHIVNMETSRPKLLMLKGGISISHIVNMETSRPTLLMLKGGISISHIIGDTDQNCTDTFCNIAFDRYNAILKFTTTAKNITISTRMYIANNRCICSVHDIHSIIIFNIAIYAIVLMYVFFFLYKLIGYYSKLSSVNSKFTSIILNTSKTQITNLAPYILATYMYTKPIVCNSYVFHMYLINIMTISLNYDSRQKRNAVRYNQHRCE